MFLAGRKSFTEKIAEKIKPESHKTAYEKEQEIATQHADHIAAANTPNYQKSTSQKMADKTHHEGGHPPHKGNSLVDKAVGAANAVAQKATNMVSSSKHTDTHTATTTHTYSGAGAPDVVHTGPAHTGVHAGTHTGHTTGLHTGVHQETVHTGTPQTGLNANTHTAVHPETHNTRTTF